MKLFLKIVTVIILILAVGCKSATRIQTAITKKDTSQTVIIDSSHADSIHFINQTLAKVKANNIKNFNTFSAKIKVNYKDKEGEQPELTVFVRIKRDSVIWVSINATIFSYEALRIYITKDSVKVLNKKDKIVQLRSVNYLRELTDLPFDFFTLQDFLLGNPIYLEGVVSSYKKNEQSIALMNTGNLFKHLITISNINYLVQHSKLDDIDPIRNRTCDLAYSNYEAVNGINFATQRRVSVSEKSKLDIDMNFKQYSFNETLSYPFSIPQNFKRQ